MKKILFILFLCLVACRKVEIVPDEPPKIPSDIFSVKETVITDGGKINFNLKTQGVYTLTLFDSVGQQVISREKFIGKIGQNSLSFYTKTLPVRYLYLSLEDENNNQIGKTLLVIK